MTDISKIAASGMQAAAVQMQSAAQNIANAQSQNHQPTAVAQTTRSDGAVTAKIVPAAPTDLSTQLVSQQEASVAERANMAVFAAAGRAYQSLLDLLR
jgi:flagellar hook-associated protein FlgK